MAGKFQLTLALLKPDITPMRYQVQAIREMIITRGFLVVATKELRLPKSRVQEFYKEHRGKFFYNRLVTYMSSGPTHAHVLYKEDAIADWRKLMGPTKVFRTRYEEPDTLRGKFGLTDTRNSSHGSDSEETAAKEIEFFFPEFDIKSFTNSEQERHLQARKVTLDRLRFVHLPVN